MHKRYYFEIGPSPRRVVVLTERDAWPRLGIEHTSVAEEMASEELSAHELRLRLEVARNTITRLNKLLSRADGQRGGPRDERERGKWERDRLAAQARIPNLERLVELTERKVAMLHAILAGKQDTDRLPPPRPRPEQGEDSTSEEPTPLVAEEEQIALIEEEDSPVKEREPDRVGEVARHLDYLNIPVEAGRPKVRELLGYRDPEFKVGDALLNEAIRYRRPVDVS